MTLRICAAPRVRRQGLNGRSQNVLLNDISEWANRALGYSTTFRVKLDLVMCEGLNKAMFIH